MWPFYNKESNLNSYVSDHTCLLYQVRELEVKFLKFIDKNWSRVQNEDEYKELEDNEKKELENAIKKIKPVQKIEKYVPPRSGHWSKFSLALDA